LQVATLFQKPDLFATEIVTTQAIDSSSLVKLELKGDLGTSYSAIVYVCAYYTFCIFIIDHDNQEKLQGNVKRVSSTKKNRILRLFLGKSEENILAFPRKEFHMPNK